MKAARHLRLVPADLDRDRNERWYDAHLLLERHKAEVFDVAAALIAAHPDPTDAAQALADFRGALINGIAYVLDTVGSSDRQRRGAR